jgi:hypothetical protein
MSAIYRRELHSYFTSPIGWLLVAFLLVMNSFYFTAYNLNGGYSNYGLVLYNILIVLLLFCPLLTMRSFSEERRQKTDQLLLCAPVRTVEIVLAKFLSAASVLAVPAAVFCTCPLVLSLYGRVDMGMNYGAILAWLLLAAPGDGAKVDKISVKRNFCINSRWKTASNDRRQETTYFRPGRCAHRPAYRPLVCGSCGVGNTPLDTYREELSHQQLYDAVRPRRHLPR